MVYWPGAPLDKYPQLERFLLKDTGARADFSTANQKLRQINHSYVEQVCREIGNIGDLTMADIGCFAGYFPVSFACRGARLAVGYDIDDRGGCIRILNKILGTDAQFIHAGYDLRTGELRATDKYDLVICHDLVQHMVEPLRFIRALSGIAKRALFLKCPGWLDSTGEKYITMGEPFGIWQDGEFPWCFDHDTVPSWALLETSLKLCGFKRMVRVETEGFPVPAASATRQFAAFSVLAFRE